MESSSEIFGLFANTFEVGLSIIFFFPLLPLNEPADAGVLQTDQLSCTLEKRCVYRQKVTGS